MTDIYIYIYILLIGSMCGPSQAEPIMNNNAKENKVGALATHRRRSRFTTDTTALSYTINLIEVESTAIFSVTIHL